MPDLRRPMRTLIIFILLALAGSQVACSSGEEKAPVNPGPEAERREALDAAQQFLALLDGDAFEESYALVASSLKAGMDRPTWEATVGGRRHAAGKVLSRELRTYGYMGDATPVPPGTYFVIEYNALFGTHLWLEKVVVSQEPDGWRIAGYFLSKMI
jgi:hypothetical protein